MSLSSIYDVQEATKDLLASCLCFLLCLSLCTAMSLAKFFSFVRLYRRGWALSLVAYLPCFLFTLPLFSFLLWISLPLLLMQPLCSAFKTSSFFFSASRYLEVPLGFYPFLIISLSLFTECYV